MCRCHNTVCGRHTSHNPHTYELQKGPKILTFEQGVLHFHFVPDLVNYMVSLVGEALAYLFHCHLRATDVPVFSDDGDKVTTFMGVTEAGIPRANLLISQ